MAAYLAFGPSRLCWKRSSERSKRASTTGSVLSANSTGYASHDGVEGLCQMVLELVGVDRRVGFGGGGEFGVEDLPVAAEGVG